MTNLHSLLVSAERLFLLFENINRAVYMWQVKGLFLMRQNILHLRIEYTCWKRDLSIDSTKEPLALEGLQLNCHGSSPSSPPNRPRLCGSKTAQMRQKWVFFVCCELYRVHDNTTCAESVGKTYEEGCFIYTCTKKGKKLGKSMFVWCLPFHRFKWKPAFNPLTCCKEKGQMLAVGEVFVCNP